MNVDWTVSGQCLQNEHAGIATRLLFVSLQQANGSRYFVVHEMFPKCCATDLGYLSESLGSSEHDVEIVIRQKRLDIIVEAEKILFEFNCLFSIHIKEMVWDDQHYKSNHDLRRVPMARIPPNLS